MVETGRISQTRFTRIAARALVKAGQGLRLASNALTAKVIRGGYFNGDNWTLMEILSNLSPRDFGERKDLVFIAMPGAEVSLDRFLAPYGDNRTLIQIKQFRNGESYAQIEGSVRGRKVVIAKNFAEGNINDQLIEVLLAIDAAKRASAEEIVLICSSLPYIGGRGSLSRLKVDNFKLVLNLLFRAAGLDELRVGDVVFNRHTSAVFLQDNVISRRIAPFMIANGVKFMGPRAQQRDDLVFFAGSGYRDNVWEILSAMRRAGFKDGKLVATQSSSLAYTREMRVEIDQTENLAGKKVYVFQTCNTGRVNDDLMEALLMIYAAKKRGAKEVVLVMPMLPYNRQERKAKPREAIAAKLVANAMVRAAGATQIITLDLHAEATQGFVDVPFQHLTTAHLIAKTLIELTQDKSSGWLANDPVIGAPDVGRGKACRWLGIEVMGPSADFVIVDKERPKPGEAEALAVVGRVEGRDVVLFDDLIDSAGTIITAAKALLARGARRVYVATTHAVFSDVTLKKEDAGEEYEQIKSFLERQGKKIEDHVASNDKSFTVNAAIRLQASPAIAGLIFTDTLNVPKKNVIDKEKVKIVSVADLIASVCIKIMKRDSLQASQYEYHPAK